jgi:hypothetical protein
MPFIGTRWITTELTTANTDYVISTDPIVVHAIVISYDGVGRRRPVLKDNDNNVLINLDQENGESLTYLTRWVADNGLKITSPSNSNQWTYVSILYSYPGP